MKKNKREREQEILEEFRQYGRTDELVREYWNLVFFYGPGNPAFS